MKINKLFAGILAVGAVISCTSCSDSFLDEELNNEYSTELLKTPEGLEMLTKSLYGNIRWHFGYEWAYGITLYGTDEFEVANDQTNEPWNTYDARLGAITTGVNKNVTQPGALWEQLYYGISSCNKIIANAEIVTDKEVRERCLAHAYFLRGYNYYRLAAQYGRIIIQNEDINTIKRDFVRATEEETWEQVISDLRKSYETFKGEEFTYGQGITWTKATAAHFLAKALLFRASERNASWNEKYVTQDIKEAIEACNYVIGARSYESNYSNLYANWTGVDCAIEKSNEILMAAPHNRESSTQGRFGNRTYNYFNPQFSNFSGGWVKRGIWIGGMDFQRCRPTEYVYASYDHVNDARLWKTFRTVYGLNNIANKNDAAEKGIKVGDPGIVMILNTKDDHTYDGYTFGQYTKKPTFTDDAGRLPEWRNDPAKELSRQTPSEGKLTSTKGQWIPNTLVLYQNGKFVGNSCSDKSDERNNFFCGINKCDDGTREAEKGDAHRDVTMARVGETYLIRAELYIRQGEYDKAKDDIDVIRRRAAWHDGENRSYYTDGSMAYPTNNKVSASNTKMYENSNLWMNTYYLSNPDIEVTTAGTEAAMTNWTWENLPAEDEAILAKIGVTSKYDRALNFLLNERTRELIGEWQRWETLSRTQTLVTRARAFNAQAAPNIQPYHSLRPMAQSFIDGLQHSDGSNLSDEEAKAWQNPGYSD